MRCAHGEAWRATRNRFDIEKLCQCFGQRLRGIETCAIGSQRNMHSQKGKWIGFKKPANAACKHGPIRCQAAKVGPARKVWKLARPHPPPEFLDAREAVVRCISRDEAG